MTDNELYGLAAKLFAEHSRWQDVGDAEATGWAPHLWKALQQTGFSDVPVPEELGGAAPTRFSCSVPREHTRRRCPWPRPGWSVGGSWRLPVCRCPRVFARYCRLLSHFVSTVIGCSARCLPWRGVTAPSISSDSSTASWCSRPDRRHSQAARPSAAEPTSPTSPATPWFSMVCR